MWTGGERKTKNIKQDVLRLCQKRSGSVYHVPFLEVLQLSLSGNVIKAKMYTVNSILEAAL